MITPVAQRWRDHRDSYRPAGEVIRTSDYEIAELRDDATPRAFVEQHHYARTFPAARFRFGLYRGAELTGVAVFSEPINEAVLRPFNHDVAAELGRFVLLDDVPANGETFFLGRCFELLRCRGLSGIASLSDPVPRTTAAGETIFLGHVGTCYQAHNATYTGRATPRTLHLLPDGSVFSARAAQKVRSLDVGWRYAVAQLLAAGAEPSYRSDSRAWLRRALAKVARRLRHHGNHRYLWALDRAARKLLPPSQPYPKFSPRSAA